MHEIPGTLLSYQTLSAVDRSGFQKTCWLSHPIQTESQKLFKKPTKQLLQEIHLKEKCPAGSHTHAPIQHIPLAFTFSPQPFCLED